MVELRKIGHGQIQGLQGGGSSALFRDCLSGLVFAVVIITYCISFSALIFQGDLAAGLPLGLSTLLMGTVVTGVVISLTTSLVPVGSGPDTPAIAVMSVLAAAIATRLAGTEMTPALIVIHVLLAISVSTVFTGLLLLGLGLFRSGTWLRFVPYPVIGGFLAASGWLLITGGIEVMTGIAPQLSLQSLSSLVSWDAIPQLLLGIGFAVTLLVLRRFLNSFLTLPLAFIGAVVLVDLVLLWGGLAERLGGQEAWYLQGATETQIWVPVTEAFAHEIHWGAIALSAAEIGAVMGVTALSVLLDVSGLEVARQDSADLDQELKSNGWANLLAGFAGGAGGNLSLSGSILMQEAGAISRLSGIFAAGFCLIVLFIGAQIVALVPTALLGGLLAYLGCLVLQEALAGAPAGRSLSELILALAIMIVIVYSGYLLGVMIGIIGACLVFAFNYSRIGVVRRHLTRDKFSSNVDRSPSEAAILKENGAQIHVMWISGFIFFGSSNRLFELIRGIMEEQNDPHVRFLVLDFASVPGLDTSAVLSLVKLRNYCNDRAANIAFAGLNEQLHASFSAADLFSESGPHRVFQDRNSALEWCEDMLLETYAIEPAAEGGFQAWLEQVFGGTLDYDRLMSYFVRRKYKAGQTMLKQGGRSDSVDLLATGTVAITLTDNDGNATRLRRMAAQTVIGEMGFFRKAPRAAAVIAEEPSVVYRLTRKKFEQMKADDPETASAFYALIVSILSDRLESANQEISALI